MANEYRLLGNGLYGQMSAGFTAAATSITDSTFSVLPVVSGGAVYMPLSFTDSNTRLTEIVWVAAHTSSSNTITVVRGKEGTTARAWITGTPWTQAETSRDYPLVVTSGTPPSEQSVGLRWTETDTGLHKVKTLNSGVVSGFGVAFPGDVGPNRFGGNPTQGSAPLIRAGVTIVTTDGSGDATISYRTPFPNGTISVLANNADRTTFIGVLTIQTDSASSFTFRANSFNSGGAFSQVSTSIQVAYIAIGW